MSPPIQPAQIDHYRTVSDRLSRAIAAQSRARAAYDAARDALDDHRDALILGGVPGVPGLPERCSSELRQAALARALAPLTATLRAARDVLRASDAELLSLIHI